MEINTKNQLQIFFDAYATLQEFLADNSLEQLRKDKIKLLALERLLGILAVTIKRLQKLNPQWEIPYLKQFIKLKNNVIWNFTPLRQSYLENVIYKYIPQTYNYLQNKLQTSNNDET